MPFGFKKSSKATNTWLIRQDKPNAYNIVTNKGDVIYTIRTKTAATKSYYFMNSGDNEVAKVEQDAIENKYKIFLGDRLTYELKVDDKEILLIGEQNLKSKPEVRSKDFQFLNEKSAIVFTIDKTKLSLQDKYRIENMKSFDDKIAILVAICLDDVYHKGLKN